MTNLERLQQNYFAEIINSGKKTFGAVTGMYIAICILAIIVSLLYVVGVIGISSNDVLDLFSGRPFFPSISNDFFTSVTFFISFIFLIIVILLLSSWFFNFGVYLSQHYLIQNTINIELAFEKSFTKKVFSTFFIYLIIGGLFLVLFSLLSFLLLYVSLLVLILMILFAQVILVVSFFRFSIAVPINLLSNEPIIASIGASFKSISFKNALGYVGILFIVLIGIGFMFLIVYEIITAIFSSIGALGTVLNSIFQVILCGFALSLTFHAIVDLYYEHFVSKKGKTLNLEDNILIDELN